MSTTFKQCLVTKGIVADCDISGSRKGRYEIQFINSQTNEEDYVTFDVIGAGTKSGNEEAETLFKDFCKTEGIRQNTVTEIHVTKSEDCNMDVKKVTAYCKQNPFPKPNAPYCCQKHNDSYCTYKKHTTRTLFAYVDEKKKSQRYTVLWKMKTEILYGKTTQKEPRNEVLFYVRNFHPYLRYKKLFMKGEQKKMNKAEAIKIERQQ